MFPWPVLQEFLLWDNWAPSLSRHILCAWPPNDRAAAMRVRTIGKSRWTTTKKTTTKQNKTKQKKTKAKQKKTTSTHFLHFRVLFIFEILQQCRRQDVFSVRTQKANCVKRASAQTVSLSLVARSSCKKFLSISCSRNRAILYIRLFVSPSFSVARRNWVDSWLNCVNASLTNCEISWHLLADEATVRTKQQHANQYIQREITKGNYNF